MKGLPTWLRKRLGLHRPAAVPRRLKKQTVVRPSKKDPGVIQPINHYEVLCDE